MAKAKRYLLFPWSLLSIILIILLSIFLTDWVGENWNWIIFVLIIPAAIVENIKSGYSSIKVMSRKIFFTMLSFLVVGISLGVWGLTYYLSEYEAYDLPVVSIPWYVFLAIAIVLFIEVANVFSLLKAALREIGTLN